MEFAVVALAAFLGGVLQGVTGFGAGLVLMMALPMLYSVPSSAAVSGLVFLVLSVAMTVQYRESLQPRKIALPLICYMALSGSSAYFTSVATDQVLIKRVFGLFLIALSIYYLCFHERFGERHMSRSAGALCVVISGLCDGLFGIGGPLLVVYFLDRFETREARLGSLQLFFTINAVYTTVVRAVAGAFPPHALGSIAIGSVSIGVGLVVANAIQSKIDDALLRKITYVLIGACGVIQLANGLI